MNDLFFDRQNKFTQRITIDNQWMSLLNSDLRNAMNIEHYSASVDRISSKGCIVVCTEVTE
jgi:hypothetical protein